MPRDVDSSATVSVRSANGQPTARFSINAAGAWTYTLDDDNAGVQALNTGAALTRW